MYLQQIIMSFIDFSVISKLETGSKTGSLTGQCVYDVLRDFSVKTKSNFNSFEFIYILSKVNVNIFINLHVALLTYLTLISF